MYMFTMGLPEKTTLPTCTECCTTLAMTNSPTMFRTLCITEARFEGVSRNFITECV